MTACPKCGGETTDWAGTPLCADWRCWPHAPSRPEQIEAGAPPLASEMMAMADELRECLRRHDEFIACAIQAQQPGTDAMATIGVVANVIADVTWLLFHAQLPPGVSVAGMTHAYVEMWMHAAGGAPGRLQAANARPPGTPLM